MRARARVLEARLADVEHELAELRQRHALAQAHPADALAALVHELADQHGLDVAELVGRLERSRAAAMQQAVGGGS